VAGGGGAESAFSSRATRRWPPATLLLARVFAILLILIGVTSWSGTRAELRAMTNTMSARVVDVEAMLRASEATLKLGEP
jgi:hypothetical protein